MTDKNLFQKLQEISPEKKEKIVFFGMMGLGVFLLLKNRAPNALKEETRLETLTEEEIGSQMKDILTRHIGTDDGLKQVARKLDARAAHFDKGAVDRGTTIEMKRIKNALVAKNRALQNLSQDPEYYDGVEIERTG